MTAEAGDPRKAADGAEATGAPVFSAVSRATALPRHLQAPILVGQASRGPPRAAPGRRAGAGHGSVVSAVPVGSVSLVVSVRNCRPCRVFPTAGATRPRHVLLAMALPPPFGSGTPGEGAPACGLARVGRRSVPPYRRSQSSPRRPVCRRRPVRSRSTGSRQMSAPSPTCTCPSLTVAPFTGRRPGRWRPAASCSSSVTTPRTRGTGSAGRRTRPSYSRRPTSWTTSRPSTAGGRTGRAGAAAGPDARKDSDRRWTRWSGSTAARHTHWGNTRTHPGDAMSRQDPSGCGDQAVERRRRARRVRVGRCSPR